MFWNSLTLSVDAPVEILTMSQSTVIVVTTNNYYRSSICLVSTDARRMVGRYRLLVDSWSMIVCDFPDTRVG